MVPKAESVAQLRVEARHARHRQHQHQPINLAKSAHTCIIIYYIMVGNCLSVLEPKDALTVDSVATSTIRVSLFGFISITEIFNPLIYCERSS